MLPIYISYFAGGGERSVKKTLSGALGVVTGFTIVFVALGALAGTLGSLLKEYQTAVNIVSGLIVVFFGLNFLGVFKWNLFKGSNHKVNTKNMGFFSALLFGIIFSVSWTPCVGASRQPIRFMSVVFPDPLLPTTARNSPRRTASETWSSACTSPSSRRYILETSRRLITSSMI